MGSTRTLESELKNKVFDHRSQATGTTKYLANFASLESLTPFSFVSLMVTHLQSDSIRTIIKARGLSYPNNTGKTFAVFRVDSIHHLVSFVSMIYPSPDWFVGIASLELCKSDGSWVESKAIDLYPWDAGTDKGITYDVIYRLLS